MGKHYSRIVYSFAEQRYLFSIPFCYVLVSAFLSLSFGESVLAQNVSGAAQAFSRAQKAELVGDHAKAAELFELADSFAPSPEALRSAIRSRKAAGHLATAAIHAETLRKRYPYDTKSQDLVDAVLLSAKQSLMRLEVECKPRVCTVLLDDAATAVELDNHHLIYVEAGTHEVVAAFDNEQSDPQFVNAEAGKRGSLTFIYKPNLVQVNEKASLPAKTNSSDMNLTRDSRTAYSEGLSIWYFLSGAVVTVGAGVATLWSGLDAVELHNEYEKNPTREIYESGLDKELRTNIFIGITVAAGVATGVLALFTQWDDSQGADSQSDLQTSVSMGPHDGILEVRGAF